MNDFGLPDKYYRAWDWCREVMSAGRRAELMVVARARIELLSIRLTVDQATASTLLEGDALTMPRVQAVRAALVELKDPGYVARQLARPAPSAIVKEAA